MREAPQQQILERQIDQALGRRPADLVVRNARMLNVVTGEIQSGDIAVCGSTIERRRSIPCRPAHLGAGGAGRRIRRGVAAVRF
jgi:adenine deaminase